MQHICAVESRYFRTISHYSFYQICVRGTVLYNEIRSTCPQLWLGLADGQLGTCQFYSRTCDSMSRITPIACTAQVLGYVNQPLWTRLTSVM